MSPAAVDLALEELAWEGPEGCTLERLCTLVGKRVPAAAPASPPGEHASPKERADGESNTQCRDDETGDQQAPDNGQNLAEISEISSETSVPNCLGQEQQRDALWSALVASNQVYLLRHNQRVFPESTEEDGTPLCQDMTIEQCTETHGAKFRIAAKIAFRNQFLYDGRVKPESVNKAALRIFLAICKGRATGKTQVELSKMLDIDPRCMYHYLKRLIGFRLVSKFPVIVKGSNTNRVVHFRFVKQVTADMQKPVISWDDNEVIEITAENETMIVGDVNLSRRVILQILDRAQDKTARISDIKLLFSDDYRRRIANTIRSLIADGFLERFDVNDEERSHVGCVRLLRALPAGYQQGGSMDGAEDRLGLNLQQEQAKEKNCAFSNSQKHILQDLPLDYQLYRIIEASGKRGITGREIDNALGGLEKKMLDRYLLELSSSKVKGSCVNRVSEFAGRERRYRYYVGRLERTKSDVADKKQQDAMAAGEGVHEAHAMDVDANSPKPTSTLASHPITEVSTHIIPRDSVTAAMRRKNLLQFLDEEKVIDLSHTFCQTYTDRFQKNAGRLDRKTLRRTANVLASQGLATITVVDVPRMSGVIETKTLLLHKDVRPDDPPVKDFIEAFRERGGPNAGIPQRAVPVENTAVGRIVSTRAKDSRRHEKMDPNSDDYWLKVALDLGWYFGKMTRAKLMHIFIWNHVSASTPADKPWSFAPSIFFRDMSVFLYLKIIGHTERSEHLMKYIESKENLGGPICNAPPKVMEEIFADIHRYRRVIRQTLAILEALGLVKKTVVSDSDGISLGFELMQEASIVNYASPEREVVSHHLLVEENGPAMYWTHLQNVCLSEHAEGVEMPMEPTVTESAGPLDKICHLRNWGLSCYFSEAQRKLLDAHIDSGTNKTPLGDDNKLLQIAEDLRVPLNRVRYYYRRFLRNHNLPIPRVPKEPKERPMGKTRKKSKDMDMSVPTIPMRPLPTLHENFRLDTTVIRSTNYQAEQQYGEGSVMNVGAVLPPLDLMTPFTQQMSERSLDRHTQLSPIMTQQWEELSGYHYSAEQLQQQLEALLLPQTNASALELFRPPVQPLPEDLLHLEAKPPRVDAKRRPSVQQETETSDDEHVDGKKKKGVLKRNRVQWTDDEDARILAAALVLQHHGKLSARGAWPAATILFPNRKAADLKRRYTLLMDKNHLQTLVDSYRDAWKEVRALAIAGGHLHSSASPNMNDPDVLGNEMWYCFAKREMLDQRKKELENHNRPQLPTTVDALHANYVVHVVKDDTNDDEELLARVIDYPTMKYCMQHFCYYMPSFPLKKESTASSELSMDPEDEVIQSTIKMSVLIPPEEYDQKESVTVLSCFPHDKVSNWIRQMRIDGIISKMKHGDVFVPGRHYRISKRMSALLESSTLPENFLEVVRDKYQQYSTMTDSVVFSELAEHDDIASLIILLIQNRVEVVAKFGDLSHINAVGSKNLDDPPVTLLVQPVVKPTAEGLLAAAAKDAGRTSIAAPALVQDICQMVVEAGEIGVRASEIQSRLSGLYSAKELMVAVRAVLESKKAYCVGQKEYRLVSKEWEPKWSRPLLKWNHAGPSRLRLVSAGDLEYDGGVLPRVWNKFDGDVERTVFQRCLKSVALLIYLRPGISVETLERHFRGLLERCELEELLQQLKMSECVQERSVKGQNFYFANADFMTRLEVPASLDPRSQLASIFVTHMVR